MTNSRDGADSPEDILPLTDGGSYSGPPSCDRIAKKDPPPPSYESLFNWKTPKSLKKLINYIYIIVGLIAITLLAVGASFLYHSLRTDSIDSTLEELKTSNAKSHEKIGELENELNEVRTSAADHIYLLMMQNQNLSNKVEKLQADLDAVDDRFNVTLQDLKEQADAADAQAESIDVDLENLQAAHEQALADISSLEAMNRNLSVTVKELVGVLDDMNEKFTSGVLDLKNHAEIQASNIFRSLEELKETHSNALGKILGLEMSSKEPDDMKAEAAVESSKQIRRVPSGAPSWSWSSMLPPLLLSSLVSRIA